MIKKLLMKRLLLVLLICLPCWAENDPTGDPNCVAYYPFTAVSPFTDATANGNDFAYQTLVAVDTVNMKTGDGCADFELDDETNIWTDDSVLSADFPARSTDSNPCFSVTGWFNPESAVDNGNLVNKYYHSTNKRCWAVASFVTSNYVWVGWGYNSGSSVRQYTCTVTDGIDTGQWYFFHVVFDDPNNTCDIRVYDATEDKWALSENTPTDAMNCEDSQLFFGRQGGGDYYDGLLDDVAIFSKVLSNADANSIVAGSFDYSADPNCISHWSFDTSGLGYDELGNNPIRFGSVLGGDGPYTGLEAVYFDWDYHYSYVELPEANMSDTFPGKSGQTNDVFTFVYWYKADELVESVFDHTRIMGKGTQDSGFITGGWLSGVSFPQNTVGYLKLAGPDPNTVKVAHDTAIDTWYHVAAVIDLPNTRLYMRLYDTNDATVYTINNAALGGEPTTSEPFRIGTIYFADHHYLGYVAELMIFDKALSDDEIDEIRGGTFGGSTGAVNNWWWRRRHNN